MKWFIAAVKKYAVFSGRARRKEFWYFGLFYLFGIFIPLLIALAVGIAVAPKSYVYDYSNTMRPGQNLVIILGGLSATWFLFCLLPSISVSVRRLHDINKSGWWIFVGCIPFGIGTIVQLVLFTMDGDPGVNQYGSNPKDPAEPKAE